MEKKYIWFLVTAALLAGVSGCGKRDAQRGKKESAIPVKIMKVKLENVRRSLEYVGDIKGIDETMVYPKVSGKIIEKVKEDGSFVEKGDVIAYIDRDEVGLKFEKAPVESPLTGTVGRVYVDIGSSVTPQSAVAFVTNMDRAQIDLEIPEKYLPKVSLGKVARVAVDAYPGETFIGKVVKISPVCDLQTHTAPIEIDIENTNHRLQSGMFAKVELVIEEKKEVPVILREAIMGKDPDTYVYVVENNLAAMRNVVLGVRQGPYYEILSGLREGDLIVIMGQQRLRDGSAVVTEE